MQIVFQAATGGPITNMRWEQDGYTLQAGENVYTGTSIPALNPCSIFDGTTIQLNAAKYAALQTLQATDAELPRVAEDLIDALIAKATIALTDLPAATQANHAAKKAARAAYV